MEERSLGGTTSGSAAAAGELIAARWPALWPRIASAQAPGSLRWTGAPRPTLQADGLHLSSVYDPEGEARLQASLIPDHSAEAWVYGVGSGALVGVLLERPALRRLHVVIMNAGLFREGLSYFNQADWLQDARVELHLGDDERRVHGPFAAVPPCLRLASSAAAPLRDRVTLELATPWIEKQHAGEIRPLAGLNAVVETDPLARIEANWPLLASDGDVAALFGTASGRPAVVAGAGPTLGDHLGWMRSTRDRFTLVAVDTSLKPLTAAGLVPDVVVSMDAWEHLARVYPEDLSALAHVPLVYFPVVASDVLTRWPGPRLAAYAERPLYRALAERLPRATLFSSGSVIHPAVDLAERMGASRIVLVGADFSYPRGQAYAAGSALGVTHGAEGASEWVENDRGERVPTKPNLRGYLRDLEDFIATRPGGLFVNAGRDGARIEGAPHRPQEAWYDA